METILDIKKALQDIPDELLGSLWFSCGENCEDQISMVASEGDGKYDFPQVFGLIDREHPQLNEFNKLVQNIARAQGILDTQGKKLEEISEKLWESEPITSSFFDEGKK